MNTNTAIRCPSCGVVFDSIFPDCPSCGFTVPQQKTESNMLRNALIGACAVLGAICLLLIGLLIGKTSELSEANALADAYSAQLAALSEAEEAEAANEAEAETELPAEATEFPTEATELTTEAETELPTEAETEAPVEPTVISSGSVKYRGMKVRFEQEDSEVHFTFDNAGEYDITIITLQFIFFDENGETQIINADNMNWDSWHGYFSAYSGVQKCTVHLEDGSMRVCKVMIPYVHSKSIIDSHDFINGATIEITAD